MRLRQIGVGHRGRLFTRLTFVANTATLGIRLGASAMRRGPGRISLG